MTSSSKNPGAPKGRKNPSARRFDIATLVASRDEYPCGLARGRDFFRPYRGSGAVGGRFSHGSRRGLRSCARFAGWRAVREPPLRRDRKSATPQYVFPTRRKLTGKFDTNFLPAGNSPASPLDPGGQHASLLVGEPCPGGIARRSGRQHTQQTGFPLAAFAATSFAGMTCISRRPSWQMAQALEVRNCRRTAHQGMKRGREQRDVKNEGCSG